MRFESYITEEYLSEDFSVDQVLELVKKNCSDIFDVMKKTHNALWRGVKTHPHSNIIEVIPRSDRKPRDTKLWLHNKLDDAFKAKFGWKVRSEGTFATASMDFAEEFGKPHMIFPFDGYKFVWNPHVHDLTAKLISFNYDLDDKLSDNMLRMWVPDEYLKYSKPDFKTGEGRGYWSIEKGNAEVDDIKGIKEYYKDRNFKIISEEEPVKVIGSDYVIDFFVNGLRKHAFWNPNFLGSEREHMTKLASKEIEERADERIQFMIKDYTDKNIESAFYEMNEISFKCKKYYIVHESMWGRLFVDYIRGHRQ